MGLCHTLVYEEAIAFAPLIISLEEAQDFKIMIHDPSYNIMRFNSHLIPSLWLNNPRGISYFLVATDHVKMNRLESPCQEDLTYNFTVCVKTSLARTIGCRLPWDPVLASAAVCNSTQQLELYESTYFALSFASDAKLVSMTGCLLPCRYEDHLSVSVLAWMLYPRYRQYTLVESMGQFSAVEATVTFSFATNDVIVEREEYIFSLESMVSEFGGALGLFLGFSFLGAFEQLVTIAEILKGKFSSKP
jgi:hypothetical protein